MSDQMFFTFEKTHTLSDIFTLVSMINEKTSIHWVGDDFAYIGEVDEKGICKEGICLSKRGNCFTIVSIDKNLIHCQIDESTVFYNGRKETPLFQLLKIFVNKEKIK